MMDYEKIRRWFPYAVSVILFFTAQYFYRESQFWKDKHLNYIQQEAEAIQKINQRLLMKEVDERIRIDSLKRIDTTNYNAGDSVYKLPTR